MKRGLEKDNDGRMEKVREVKGKKLKKSKSTEKASKSRGKECRKCSRDTSAVGTERHKSNDKSKQQKLGIALRDQRAPSLGKS